MGEAVEVAPAHIDSILGRGEPDLVLRARALTRGRRGAWEARRVGAELARRKDFSATLTQADFAKNLKLLPTAPALLAGRMGALVDG